MSLGYRHRRLRLKQLISVLSSGGCYTVAAEHNFYMHIFLLVINNSLYIIGKKMFNY